MTGVRLGAIICLTILLLVRSVGLAQVRKPFSVNEIGDLLKNGASLVEDRGLVSPPSFSSRVSEELKTLR